MVHRRKTANEEEQQLMALIVNKLPMTLDARLEGATIRAQDLLHLEKGDVLTLEVPLSKPIRVNVNGKKKFQGEVVVAGRNRAVLIHRPEEH